MIYGYIRVSSDKQTVENQRFEIQRFCNQQGLHIDGWIEETIYLPQDFHQPLDDAQIRYRQLIGYY